jgi:uncharacterized membrane protein
MAPRVQIVLSSRRPAETQSGAPLGFWQRFKIFGIISVVVLIALAALALLLALGSIVATLLWVLLVIAIAIVAVKNALKRARTVVRR